MDIYDAVTAEAWLRSWGPGLRKEILLCAIRGMKVCVSLSPAHAMNSKYGYEKALAVLVDALNNRRKITSE